MKVGKGMAALITGAGDGIGRAIALRLGELGANITVIDISEAGGKETVRLIREGRQAQSQTVDNDGGIPAAIFVKCDVTSSQQLSLAFDEHMRIFRRLDICINNAGIGENVPFYEDQTKGEEVEEDDTDTTSARARQTRWRRVIDVNMTAVIDGTRLAIQAMSANSHKSERGERKDEARAAGGGGGGVIVNIGSASAIFPFGVAPVYAGTKAGVVMFTRSLKNLEKDRGIRVCTFCPEFIDTSLVRRGGELTQKAVIATGGFIPMETAVKGLIRLIEDERNGGSVMRVSARKGTFYWSFGGEKIDVKDLNSTSTNLPLHKHGVSIPNRLSVTENSAQQQQTMTRVPTTFRKVVVYKLSPDFRAATRIVTVPLLPFIIGKGMLLVRILFAGVNASDVNFSAGRYSTEISNQTAEVPFDSGFEGVGHVVGIGEGTTLLPGIGIGSPVAIHMVGAFSEYIQVNSKHVIPIPIASPAMVAMLTSGLTASIALERAGRMGKGETVMVTAAAGGTGQFAVQLAKLAGNRVIGTCGGADKAALLRRLGVDRVIDYNTEDVASVLKSEFPKGVDLIYESVGGSMLETCLKSLSVKGRLIVIGMISQYAEGEGKAWKKSKFVGLPEKLLWKSQSLVGFFLMHYRSDFGSHIAKLHDLYTSGFLKIAIDPTPFMGVEAVADAVEYLHSGKSIGKVVVQISKDVGLLSNLKGDSIMPARAKL